APEAQTRPPALHLQPDLTARPGRRRPGQLPTEDLVNDQTSETKPDAVITIEISQTRRGTQVSTHVQAANTLGPAVPGAVSEIAVKAGEQMAGVVGAACQAHADALQYRSAPVVGSRPQLPTVRDPRIGMA